MIETPVRTARVRRAAHGIACVALLVASVSSCATTGAAGGALRSRSVASDDRVVLQRHSDVLAVAASSRHVFALTTRGLLAYDRVFARWRPPSSRVDDDLALAGVSRVRNAVLAADPVEEAVWIGVPGAVVLYRVQTEQVQRITVVGQPEIIAFVRGGADAFVRASGQWLRISRAGFVTPLPGGIGELALVSPPQLSDVYRRYPALRGQLAFLLRDDSAAPNDFVSVTAGTLSPDQSSEVWIGTRAHGLWRVDANFQRADPLRYGLLDDMIGAVTVAGNGVWTGGQGLVRGGGLSFVRADLEQFTFVSGDANRPFEGARTTVLATRAGALWSGTDRGVVRLRLAQTSRAPAGVTQWGTLHGLPSERVTALVPRDAGAWVATSRGLAFIHDSSPNNSVRSDVIAMAFAGQPVRALVLVSDTLVIGTTDGVHAMSAREPASDAVRETPRRLLPALPAFRRPTQALVWSDSVLLVVTDQRAHLLSRRDAMRAETTTDSARAALMAEETPITDRDLATVGAIVGAEVDARSVWIAGTRGVLAFSRAGGLLRVMYSGQELPADVTALTLDTEWAWIGTNNGLVRVRRARDGGLP